MSATAPQRRRRCTVVADETAASLLQGKEYYRWIFDTEPEWREFKK
jgi:hypothetical protein